MARISNEEVAKREAFMRKLFQTTPTLTAAAANEQLKKEFGSQMRSARVYEIRDEVRKEIAKLGTPATSEAAQGSQTTAGRNPAKGKRGRKAAGRKQAKAPAPRQQKAARPVEPVAIPAAEPRIIKVSPQHIAAVEAGLTHLREAGLTKHVIEHKGADYIVIR